MTENRRQMIVGAKTISPKSEAKNISPTHGANDYSVLRSRLLALVGTPYGDSRFEPADCWGFVRYCYSLTGIDLPKNIWSCRHLCEPVGAKNFLSLQFLDVIYFRDFLVEARHIGVALDNIYVLQSSRCTNGVAALRLNRPGIAESVAAVYRLRQDAFTPRASCLATCL